MLDPIRRGTTTHVAVVLWTSAMASVLIAPQPGFVPQIQPAPRRWTVAEFHQLCGMGWFDGKRAMLIDGDILEMPGPNPPHATANTLADYECKRVFGSGYLVRVQMPLILGL